MDHDAFVVSLGVFIVFCVYNFASFAEKFFAAKGRLERRRDMEDSVVVRSDLLDELLGGK